MPSGSARPVRGPRPHDVICQSQTLAALGARCHSKPQGYVRCARAVVPHMIRRGGGTIVNVTGTTRQAIPFHTPSSACNAALRMFS